MFVFAALILLMALLIYKGNTGLIRTMEFTKVKDKKEYARFFGKSLAIVALAPIIAGIAGLFLDTLVSVIIFVVLLFAAIVLVAKKSKKYY